LLEKDGSPRCGFDLTRENGAVEHAELDHTLFL